MVDEFPFFSVGEGTGDTSPPLADGLTDEGELTGDRVPPFEFFSEIIPTDRLAAELLLLCPALSTGL